jgi:hypothetical protein
MPATPHTKPTADREAGQEHLNGVIGDRVIHALGRPADRYRVQVRRLWGDRYRVNVLVGGDVTTTTVAHSYFLVADGDGNISATTPALTRRYGPTAAAGA